MPDGPLENAAADSCTAATATIASRWCHKFTASGVAKRHRRSASLCWDVAPERVLLAVTPHSQRACRALPILARHLTEVHGMHVLVEEKMLLCADGHAEVVQKDAHGAVSDEVHMVFCLGGDGLILHVVSTLFPRRTPPIMPFNLGSLGFLTPFDFAEHPSCIDTVLKGGHHVTLRMRLRCRVVRAEQGLKPSSSIYGFDSGELGDCGAESGEYHVLNEMVIDRGPAPYLSNLEVLCDDLPVTRVQADGLIVATPTGSTAYSMSAGGSMVHPAVPAILFTPICPHSLSFRPILFPDYVTLTIKVPDDSRACAWVSFDGRHRRELMRGDKVCVDVSTWPVPTFCKDDPTADWFKSISESLHWNMRRTQGANDATENGVNSDRGSVPDVDQLDSE